MDDQKTTYNRNELLDISSRIASGFLGGGQRATSVAEMSIDMAKSIIDSVNNDPDVGTLEVAESIDFESIADEIQESTKKK